MLKNALNMIDLATQALVIWVMTTQAVLISKTSLATSLAIFLEVEAIKKSRAERGADLRFHLNIKF